MWAVYFSNESIRTLNSFDMKNKKHILAGIQKAARCPLPLPEGCGMPLHDRGDSAADSFYRIDLRNAGVSIVYSLSMESTAMNILFIVKTG